MTRIETRRRRSVLVLFGLCIALYCADAAAELQLEIGEPFELDAPVEATGGGPFTRPKVAGSDDGFLVSSGWFATRVDPTSGAALDPDGQLLLPLLEMIDYDLYGVILSSNGTTYLVLAETNEWEQGEYELVAVVVDAATFEPIGDAQYLAPCGGSGVGEVDVTAMDGGDYLVAWREDGIRAVRIDAGTGAALDQQEGLQILDGSHGIGGLAVAGGSQGFLVSWIEYGATGEEIRATRVGPGGSVLDPGGLVVSADVDYVAHLKVAAGGTGFVVFWSDFALETRIGHATVGSDGTVGPVVDTHTLDEGRFLTSLSAAAAGSWALVAWSEEDEYSSSDPFGTSDVFGIRVDGATGLVLTAPLDICVHPGQQEAEASSTAGGEILAVWQDRRNNAWHVYGARVNEGGVEDPEGLPILTAANDQMSPVCAGFDGGYFVSWSDSRNGKPTGPDIFAIGLGADGAAVYPEAVQISDGDAYEMPIGILAQGSVALVFTASIEDSGQTLAGVSWIDEADGDLLAGSEIEVGEGTGSWPMMVPLEVDGTVVLPYAMDNRISALVLDLVDGLVPMDGVLRQGPEPEEEGELCHVGDLAAAAIGDVVLLAWREGCEFPGTEKSYYDEVMVQRFALSSASVLEPVGDLATLHVQWRAMTLIPREDDFLILASRSGPGETGVSKMLIPVDPEAPLESEQLVMEPPYDVNDLSAQAFEGGIFVGMRSYVPIPDSDGSALAVFGAVLDDDLEVLVEPISVDPDALNFALAARGEEVLVVSQIYEDTSARLVGRIVSLDDPEDPQDASIGDQDGGIGVGAITGCSCEVAGRAGAFLPLLIEAISPAM